jgi:hypothetical protein
MPRSFGKHDQTVIIKAMTTDATQTIPLLVLADAWQTTVEALTKELGGKVITDALRIKHVAVQDAIALLEQRDAEQARHRLEDEQWRAAMAALQAPVLARVAALQAKQHAQHANGQIDAGTSALVAMTMNDPNSGLEAAGRRTEELLTAAKAGHYGVMHTFGRGGVPAPGEG